MIIELEISQIETAEKGFPYPISPFLREIKRDLSSIMPLNPPFSKQDGTFSAVSICIIVG